MSARMKVFLSDRWEEVDAEDCKHCNGSGEVLIDRPVVDYEQGGYLETLKHKCSECDGSGWKPKRKKSIAEEFALKPIPRDKMQSYRISNRSKYKKVSSRKRGKSKYG